MLQSEGLPSQLTVAETMRMWHGICSPPRDVDPAHLAPGATKNYLSSAMNKVGAQNRFEAHMRARELGWV